jgi:hypothetical protein
MTDNPNSFPWRAIIAMWIPGLAMLVYLWRKLRQDRRERHPDPDAVMAQRQLYADGEFRRHWTRRLPHDLHMDRLDLECGHWTYHTAGRPLDSAELVECHDCAREYLKSAQKGLRR